MSRRYAARTNVSVSKSRGEIDRLLRQWGAIGVQWTDDFECGRVALRFGWDHEGSRYQAKFIVELEHPDDIRDQCRHATTGAFLQSRYEKMMDARGKQEHRLLLLLLKAAFNAVESGVMTAEQFFLPWLEDASGRTVGEQILPQMQGLLTGSATNLLALPKGKK